MFVYYENILQNNTILSQYDFDLTFDPADPAFSNTNPLPPAPASTVAQSLPATLAASSVPMNTRKSTNWAVHVWKELSAHRRSTCPAITEWPVQIHIAQPQVLDYWLNKFVLEARKGNGEPYPPDTLSMASTLVYWDTSRSKDQK